MVLTLLCIWFAIFVVGLILMFAIAVYQLARKQENLLFDAWIAVFITVLPAFFLQDTLLQSVLACWLGLGIIAQLAILVRTVALVCRAKITHGFVNDGNVLERSNLAPHQLRLVSEDFRD